MTQLLWELEEVTLAGRAKPRLDRISCTLESGYTAVVGSSGAGKTSLLNLLVEFERPHSGSLKSHLVDDQHLPFFWVPQNAGLWGHLNALEHLLAVSQDEAQNIEILKDFGLGEQCYARPGSMSAGQRGRLSVARAVASQANVLVMDEPFANVDLAGSHRYWQVIRERTAGKSLIFATHSVDTVLREADRVVCLEAGRIPFCGSKQELYDNPPTPELAAFLGPANWFDDHERGEWIQGAGPACVRPERLKVEPCADSPFRVQANRRGITLGELEVAHVQSNERRTVFYRPNGRHFRVGEHVLLRLLLVVLMCCLTLGLPGCSSSSDAPDLACSAVNHWSIPAAGKVIPAPRSVRFGPDNELFVLDNAGRVLVYSTQGKLLRQWEMPAYDVGKPEGICVLQDGRIAVTDTHYHRVVFFDREGSVVGMHGEHGRGPGQFVYPVAITQDDDENYYICEYGDNDRVQKFSVDGSLLLEFGSFGTKPGEFQRPSGVVWDDHQVFVADAINNRVQVFSDTGDFQQVLSWHEQLPSLHYPYDLILGQEGQLFAVEYGAGRVTEMSKSGQILSRWGKIGTAKGCLTTPWGLAIHPDGQLVVADTGNRRLVEIQR